MKTKPEFFLLCLGLFLSSTLMAQTNYSVNLPAGHEVDNLFGNVCCFFKGNIATDESGNAYVLSEISSDSSIWVTKYDNNGTQLFNVRVGVPGNVTLHKYFAKKIKIYGNRIYVLCTTIFNEFPGQVYQTVYVAERNSGILFLGMGYFTPFSPYTNSELVDLFEDGTNIYLLGNVWYSGGPGRTKIQICKSDLLWTGNTYVFGNDASTDYYVSTESSTATFYNGSLYMAGVANYAGNQLKILVGKFDTWAFWTEYKYENSSYTVGAKGLSIAAEGNSVYAAGALRAQLNKPLKAAVIKIDTSLTTPTWVSINPKSEWPGSIQLTSGNVIYTVDYALRVVGFSKTNGSQLFAKNDFKNYAQVYNQPVSTVLLSNNQLMIQASVGVKVMGNNTVNKVIAKYSTAGTKTYQQLESLSMVSPGNPGYAEALGLAYSTASDYAIEVFRKFSTAGDLIYVNGRNAPTALRVAAAQGDEALQLSVFPNPARENFKIKSEEKITHWILFDSIGQQVLASDANDNEIEVDCSPLSDGMYFLNITTEDNQLLAEKLIISR